MLLKFQQVNLQERGLRWEDNIRIDLEEIGANAGNWVDLTQGLLESGIEPPGSIGYGFI